MIDLSRWLMVRVSHLTGQGGEADTKSIERTKEPVKDARREDYYIPAQT
jgi:hypothetical protein